MIFKLHSLIGLLAMSIAFHLNHAKTWQPAHLSGVQERIVHSNASEQDYRIQVATIGSADDAGYPVLYLLDGNITLPLASIMMQSHAFLSNRQQGVLLVGIDYPENQANRLEIRQRDDTNAVALHQYIQQELKPIIEQTFPVNQQKQALMGHSYGGLYALYNLFNHTDDFSAYIIASPSIWWSNQRILADEHNMTHAPDLLSISVGEYEQTSDPNAPDSLQRQHKKAQRKMVDNARFLSQRLQNRFPKQAISLRIYEGENHGTVIPRSISDGLKALYRQWYGKKNVHRHNAPSTVKSTKTAPQPMP